MHAADAKVGLHGVVGQCGHLCDGGGFWILPFPGGVWVKQPTNTSAEKGGHCSGWGWLWVALPTKAATFNRHGHSEQRCRLRCWSGGWRQQRG